VTGSRRLSQAISEGDGISLIVSVQDAASARRAEEQGAEAVAVAGPVAEIRAATSLPILQLGAASDGGDACVIVAEDNAERLEELQALALDAGLECVVDVHDDEELELALERIDPEVFLISPRSRDDDEEALDRVLDLLPDVPAGKLAIADVPVTTRAEVVALERAGFDAVLLGGVDVAGLSGHPPPAV
jgi:indole-3-glycerol phosphate synthase